MQPGHHSADPDGVVAAQQQAYRFVPMDIEWEEPPAYANVIGSGKQPGKYLEFALALRQHPGRWAVLPTDGTRTEKGAMATAQNIRRGKVKGFKAGQYETAVHETKIWVRFKKDQPAEQPNGNNGAAVRATPTSGGPPDDDGIVADAKTVRAWAVEKGMDVPERGRLPQRYFDAYEQAVARGEVEPPEAESA